MTRTQKGLSIVAAVLLAIAVVQALVLVGGSNDLPGRFDTVEGDGPGVGDTVRVGELDVRVVETEDDNFSMTVSDLFAEESTGSYARDVELVTVAISNPTDDPHEIGLVNSVLVDHEGRWDTTTELDWLDGPGLAGVVAGDRAMPPSLHVNPGQEVRRVLVFDAGHLGPLDHVRLVGGTEWGDPLTGEQLVALTEP
ncbi:hypothetical protein ACPYO6_03500 [Georgenia sp. Z1344]|uniref:hypothetical protein n=1 Tax=Georgenia sp. Z1344 TaxID=3416706 RepID=UPI003CF429DE